MLKEICQAEESDTVQKYGFAYKECRIPEILTTWIKISDIFLII